MHNKRNTGVYLMRLRLQVAMFFRWSTHCNCNHTKHTSMRIHHPQNVSTENAAHIAGVHLIRALLKGFHAITTCSSSMLEFACAATFAEYLQTGSFELSPYTERMDFVIFKHRISSVLHTYGYVYCRLD